MLESGQSGFAKGEEILPHGIFFFGQFQFISGPVGEMDGSGFISGEEFPSFLSGENAYGRKRAGERGAKAMEGSLSSASTRGISGVGIETVLHAIVINGGKLDGDELADSLVNDVVLEPFVGGGDIAEHAGEPVENPAVEPGEFGVGHSVLGGIEVEQIAQLIAQRVAQIAICFGDLLDAFSADGDVVAKILRGHPQPHDVRAVLADVCLARLRLGVSAFAALGDFFTVGIHHESVREHRLEWRLAVARQ